MVLGGNVGFQDDTWVIMPWLGDFKHRRQKAGRCSSQGNLADIESRPSRSIVGASSSRGQLARFSANEWQGPREDSAVRRWPHASGRDEHRRRLRRHSPKQLSTRQRLGAANASGRGQQLIHEISRRGFRSAAAPPRARGRCGRESCAPKRSQVKHSGGPADAMACTVRDYDRSVSPPANR